MDKTDGQDVGLTLLKGEECELGEERELTQPESACGLRMRAAVSSVISVLHWRRRGSAVSDRIGV